MKIYTLEVAGYSRTVKVNKHHWAKRMTLKLSQNGNILVTIPRFATYKQAARFIEENTNWLNLKLSGIKPQVHRAASTKEKNQARRLITSKLQYWNRYYNQKWNKVFIRNQTTRWGSCSSVGNLNFNWRVINLPEELQDYIVVHELAHLLHHNHSPAFWQTVGRALPDYKKLRQQLAKYELTN